MHWGKDLVGWEPREGCQVVGARRYGCWANLARREPQVEAGRCLVRWEWCWALDWGPGKGSAAVVVGCWCRAAWESKGVAQRHLEFQVHLGAVGGAVCRDRAREEGWVGSLDLERTLALDLEQGPEREPVPEAAATRAAREAGPVSAADSGK